MKLSEYKSYDDLPLFLNAEMVAKVLGVAKIRVLRCCDARNCWWPTAISCLTCLERRRRMRSTARCVRRARGFLRQVVRTSPRCRRAQA